MELSFDGKDKILYVSFWHKGFSHGLSLFNRFLWAWKILKTGNPYSDEIIITNKVNVSKTIHFLKEVERQLYL
jgi:hypothetical protein